LLRFVRALVGGGEARADGDLYTIDERSAPSPLVLDLVHSGALDGDSLSCRANGVTRSWVHRQMLEPEDLAAQHRRLANGGDLVINLAESPLARLSIPATAGQQPFLQFHQIEAGERVRRLVERAQLQPRVTMTYSASRTAGKRQNHAAEITDLAADARKALADIHTILPRECAGVVLDVCGLLKGLQQVEAERGWPRRSAKLVLRIGLDRLAEHYGIGASAIGVESRVVQKWMEQGARPERFE
jgi:hypothetical protein